MASSSSAPIHIKPQTRIFQREGFTFDTLLGILRRTAFNPYITLPLLLSALYTERGRALAEQRPKAQKWLKILLGFGILRKLTRTLDSGVTNNWSNDVYDWRKEIVLVTGGSDGIGAQVVRMFASRGIKVVVLDIQPLKFEAPPNVHFFKCDLSNPEQIRTVAANVSSTVGYPTVLINNAGFARGKTILDASESDLRLTFQINAIAHYHLAQAFLPAMIQKNHGMVVTVASLAAYITAPQLVDYCASKAAALTFHEGLQSELASIYKAPNVRTVVLCQGYTRTALFQGFDSGDGFLSYVLKPETVAEAIVQAVFRGRSDHIILPQGNSLMSGVRFWPIWMQAGLRKDLRKLMQNWRGRQVEQPSEATKSATDGNGDRKMNESGVLV